MAYNSGTIYITNDDILNFMGLDLQYELKDSLYDNASTKVRTFLNQVTRWTYIHIYTHYDIDNWDDDTFTEALKWQVKHILKYGEDNKLDEMAYDIMHESGMINPRQQDRVYRWY